MEDEWLTVAEAAQRLGVPYREVYRLIDAGVLPAVHMERELRVASGDVDARRGAQ